MSHVLSTVCFCGCKMWICNVSELENSINKLLYLKIKTEEDTNKDVTCKACNIYYLALYRKICQQLFCSFSV